MDLRQRSAATMKLVGGRLCLDFVNTVGGRNPDPARLAQDPYAVIILRDKLNDYLDLLAWSGHTRVIERAEIEGLIAIAEARPEEAASVVDRARSLREAIYRICRASLDSRRPPARDLALLNGELAEGRRHEELVPADGRLKWGWSDARGRLDQMLWPVASSAADLLTHGDLSRLQICGGEDCHWLFEDTSKNRRRQWCNMEDCGNLAKVRRFRARHRNAG